jgi:septal ring factor EnvC (AmiA/AmiB activator)
MDAEAGVVFSIIGAISTIVAVITGVTGLKKTVATDIEKNAVERTKMQEDLGHILEQLKKNESFICKSNERHTNTTNRLTKVEEKTEYIDQRVVKLEDKCWSET